MSKSTERIVNLRNVERVIETRNQQTGFVEQRIVLTPRGEASLTAKSAIRIDRISTSPGVGSDR
jgi:hypothetical protein